jgi:signal transduction histidine kinase
MITKCSGVLFLFLVFVQIHATAQNLKSDSLLSEIEKTKPDTSRVNLMISLANEFYWSGLYDNALASAEDARKLASELGFEKGIGNAMISSGQSHIRKGQYDRAYDAYRLAVDIFTSLNLPSEQASGHLYLGQVYDYRAEYNNALAEYELAKELAIRVGNKTVLIKILNSSGITHFNKGNYELALEYYLNALKEATDIEHEKLHATILNNIGVVYIQLSQYHDALRYFLLYVEKMKKLNGRHGLAAGYLNAGETYKKLGDYTRAIEFLNNAAKIQEETGDRKGLALSFSNLGDVHKDLQDFERAQRYYTLSISFAREIKNDEVLLNPLIGVSDLHLKSKAHATAQQTVAEALMLSKKIGAKLWMQHAYLITSRLDSAKGDFRAAFSSFKKYAALKDSLLDEYKTQQIFQARELYESERKDKEIKLLSESNKLAEVKRDNTKRSFLMILVFLFFTLLIMVYWLLQNTRHSKILKRQKDEIFHANNELRGLVEKIEVQNEALARTNENLKELHQEKDALIGVVVHDLRSPLNQITGLAELVRLTGDINEEQKLLLENINKACKGGNRLICELLEMNQYETEEHISLRPIALVSFITDHLHNYRLQAKSKNISVQFDPASNEGLVIESNPDYLKRILDNLVGNAIKFSPQGCKVWVRIDQSEENVAKLIVQDEGPGFKQTDLPHLFKKFKKLSARPTAGENSTGLGLSIVKTLVNKLNGSIGVRSKEGEGASFIINLPIAQMLVAD